MATYPAALYTHTTIVDNSDFPKAADINLPGAEIVAIETELGTNPKSIDDTVTATSSPASVAAALDMIAYLLKTLTLSSNWYSATTIRHKPRVTSEASSATPTINTDNSDIHQITALAEAITSFTTNLSGTPNSGQELDIEILDNGTARAITWGASFASGPATLPNTTILSKWLYVKFRYSSSRSKWICLATGSEA